MKTSSESFRKGSAIQNLPLQKINYEDHES
jgi:hypothetical protein